MAMTLGQLLRVLVVRWYVVLAILLVTAGAAFVVSRAEGVYTARSTVRLLTPPAFVESTSAIGVRTDGLVDFAAVIVTEVSGNGADLRFASPDATLAGAGVRSGTSMRILDIGGQWSPRYEEPLIIVDVVDPDPEVVRTTTRGLVEDIARVVRERETSAGVAVVSRVGILVSPEDVVVGYAKGSRMRSMAATALFGAGAAVVLAVAFDSLAKRRTREAVPSDRPQSDRPNDPTM